jgi:hypothetical protein
MKTTLGELAGLAKSFFRHGEQVIVLVLQLCLPSQFYLAEKLIHDGKPKENTRGRAWRKRRVDQSGGSRVPPRETLVRYPNQWMALRRACKVSTVVHSGAAF